MKNFIDMNIATLSKALVIDGTATRMQFWYFILFTWLVDIFAAITDIFLPGNLTQNIASILLFVPTVAVGIRRMHDVDRAGWWFLFPFVNFVFLVSQSKPNRWG